MHYASSEHTLASTEPLQANINGRRLSTRYPPSRPEADHSHDHSVPADSALRDSDDRSMLTESSNITCSLASTRMSPNQTCDDLPGLGRVIDTYFYQPGGRLLERQINRFLSEKNMRKERKMNRIVTETIRKEQETKRLNAERETREALSEIAKASDAINTFFNSVLSQAAGYSLVSHSYWTWTGLMKLDCALTELLYFWGAQNIESWDDSAILGLCTQIASFVTSSYFNVRASAVERAFFLLSKFPRLRRFFDLPALRQELHRDGIADAVYPANLYVMHSTFDDRGDINNLLEDLATALPVTEITDANIVLCRPSLLSFVAKLLDSHLSDIGLGRGPWNLILQLLSLPDIFQPHDLRLDWDHPVLVFWKTISNVIYKRHRSLSFLSTESKHLLFQHLSSRLEDTSDILLPDEGGPRKILTSDTELPEWFVRFYYECSLNCIQPDRAVGLRP